MAKTVGTAFSLFLTNFVRIDKDRNDVAKASKGNLLAEIERFPDDGRFFKLYPGMSFIDYGSYSRKTKIRELDDIDLMIVMNAEGNYRQELWGGGYQVRLRNWGTRQDGMVNPGTDIVNSIKVVNRFKDYLKGVSSYEKADIKRNQEAATLKLKSYEWVYDIVPCFQTVPINGDTFFLIPDGKGNWKPTDPRIDKERTARIHSQQAISVLDMIRLMKYWTKRRTAATMGSYFLECLILDYYERNTSGTDIAVELRNLFAFIFQRVHQALLDPKGYQGDLNTLNLDERNSIQSRASLDYNRANDAINLKSQGRDDLAIAKWIEVFGPDFPTY
ncbi:nucleotidyltransferase family protein [Chitinophaga filiformis]|uniref:Nucleotidyltransferase n=1 Tax=Chitinophaga filiformis TaxID=104663 RepID=A0A1G7MIK1_CHIFI|nr:hypothetical protein [Chitinophaga filiformis]SDF60940.1 hypothetical protein SAMN04488121_102422 [Chitinophaga filiformis]